MNEDEKNPKPKPTSIPIMGGSNIEMEDKQDEGGCCGGGGISQED